MQLLYGNEVCAQYASEIEAIRQSHHDYHAIIQDFAQSVGTEEEAGHRQRLEKQHPIDWLMSFIGE